MHFSNGFVAMVPFHGLNVSAHRLHLPNTESIAAIFSGEYRSFPSYTEYFGPSEAPSFKGAGPVGLSRLQDLTLRPYSPVQELLFGTMDDGFR